MNRISAFIKGDPESFLTPSAVGRHSEKTAVYEPGSRTSLGTESASILIWDSPASRTVNNTYYFSHPVRGGFIIAVPMDKMLIQAETGLLGCTC